MTAGRVTLLLALGSAVLAGCGGGMSLTEYADELNAIEAAASAEADRLLASAQGVDLTPQMLQRGLEASGEIRERIQQAADEIEPPDEVAGLHDRIFAWHEEFMTVEADLADIAGATLDTDEGWTALSASDEMAAYRRALEQGKEICDSFQAELDDTEARGEFADVPWLPSRMSEAVEAVLGCEWFPDDPSIVFLWPPP